VSADNTRIFLSYAHKDLPRVQALYKQLCEAGFEPWMDSRDIVGGEDWKRAIRKAIKKAPFFVACLSSHSITHRGEVQVEFREALDELRKKLATDIYLIPVRLEECEVPEEHEFRSFHWIDLYKPCGFKNLAQALREGLNRLGLIQKITLRSTPIDSFGDEDVKQMLQQRGLFDKEMNPTGTGIKHQYELSEKASKQVVIDHGTGLTWQQAGSSGALTFKKAHDYIRQLNQDNHAGYTDWRLPTLEEAMSLMEPRVNEHTLFINPFFDNPQDWIWTSDKYSASVAWYVNFNYGSCNHTHVNSIGVFVRAVR